MDSNPNRWQVEQTAQRAEELHREPHLAEHRLSRAHLWARISLAIAIAYAVITAAVTVVGDRPLQALAPAFASAVVFLVGATLQLRLIGSRVAQPERLGRESWNAGLSLLFSVVGSYLSIVAVGMIFPEATGFSGRSMYLGFLLILLLFTAPLGFLLEASTLATRAAARSQHGSATAADPDLEWAYGKLARARLWATIALGFALIAAFGLAAIGFYYAWAPFEKVLLGFSGVVVLLGGFLQLRRVSAQAADPASLGRQSKKQAMTLLWSVLGAHAAIAMAGMVATFTSGEIAFAPTLGFILSGVVLAGPCGALLDASRAATQITGTPAA